MKVKILRSNETQQRKPHPDSERNNLIMKRRKLMNRKLWNPIIINYMKQPGAKNLLRWIYFLGRQRRNSQQTPKSAGGGGGGGRAAEIEEEKLLKVRISTRVQLCGCVCASSGEWERMWAPKVVPGGRRQWVRPEEPPIEPHSPQVQWCAECRRKAHLVKMWNDPEEVDELVWNFPRLVCIFVGKQPRRKPQTCKWAYLARE